MLNGLVKAWIMRSLKIQEPMESLKAPLLTYEDFCRNPSSIINKLNTPSGVSNSINPDANVKVKDYPPQPIINQNERQISKLADNEIEHISMLLKSNSELVEYFGYQLLR